jgi:hypothetical protein
MKTYTAEDITGGTLCLFPLPWTVQIILEQDDAQGKPWKEECGHGDVSEWVRRDKKPGERLLYSDRGGKLFYDFAGAIETAKREQWGCDLVKLEKKLGRKPTKGEIAVQAVESDFELLRRWCEGDWFYGVLCVRLVAEDGDIIETEYLGGVSSEGEHWKECAADMINTLLEPLQASFAHRELLAN